jgi:PilZ domain-containing protein
MQRRSPRQAVDRPAKVYVGDTEPLPCRIRDISQGGAKLYVFWKGWLPNSFDLADTFTNTRRPVRVVWIGLAGVGVRFADESRVVPRSTGFGRRQTEA